jgi:hypothetical protein
MKQSVNAHMSQILVVNWTAVHAENLRPGAGSLCLRIVHSESAKQRERYGTGDGVAKKVSS